MTLAIPAARWFNRPLALAPNCGLVAGLLADEEASFRPVAFGGPAALVPMQDFNAGYDVVQGVAIIQITGLLLQKLGTVRPSWGMTGYDGIRQNFLLALHDPAVEAIAFDIDSPGGDVAGCFDLSDTIYAARGLKPVWAILGESAYSAAYALASAADRIVLPRTGGAGSIGVICLHLDISRALDEAGLTVTLIQYGARKADGQPYVPFSDAARARLQADVDAMGDLFAETVARNRGIGLAAIKATEAATFMAREAVSLGLADSVMAPDAAFQALLDTLG